MKHGKKYSESAKLVEHLKLYDTAEALDLCTKTGKAKFDETVEVHVRLGVDSRHADQQVRGAVVLPNGTGKKVRVAVFAKADKAQAALDAGAEIVGAEDLMERIQKEGTKTGKAKFDETVEVHVRLGVDSRHADQQVRGAVVLPNGTGKKVRVAVFAKADKAQAALDAGAEIVGAEDLMERIQKEGFMEFDVVIASPDMMGVVGRLGKILGPRGLMPNPKAGTVTPDVAKAVQEAKAGKIEYRLDKTNIIHCPIGKVSFGAEKLQQNFDTLLGAIVKAKPAAAKGQYVKSCVVATTMGPGIKINPGRFI